MNNNLPPELVEKYYKDLPQWVNKEDAKRCAQIAVDYTDEQNAYIQHTYNESLELLQKQRNELVELIKKMTDRIRNDIGGNNNEASDYLQNLVLDAEILIKTIEDGKE